MVVECVAFGLCCVWALARVELQSRSVVWCVCKTCVSGPRSLIVTPNPGGINGHQRGGQGDWEGGSNASGKGGYGDFGNVISPKNHIVV